MMTSSGGTKEEMPDEKKAIMDVHVNTDLPIEATIRRLTIPGLKAKQYSVLKAFLQGKDAFGFSPMGFGKSLIYQLAPLMHEEMG